MAEGFEPYHVPQQSRRDKLRVNNNQLPVVDNTNLQSCAALLPFYDPSLVSSDFINSAPNQTYLKGEGINLMGFMGANHMYVDPQLSVQLNPSSIHHINNGGNPCVYNNYSGGGGGATSGQSLSLSLSSHHSNLPLELNLQRCDESSMFGDNKVSGGYVGKDGFASSIHEICKSPVPLGPFTGYASVLKGSRFLKPAQQLLEELCDVGRGGFYADKDALLDPPPTLGENLSENGIVDDSLNCSDGGEQTRKKSKLLSMLDEVYKRYKQYYQQMQAAVAAFESVAGLTTAAPFANLALKALSKHFRCLKNAITDQLNFTSKSHGKMNYDRDEAQKPDNLARATYSQRPFHIDQPVWRPQRGLPEHAVTVLRAWLFEHFLHPYPTDTDKLMLAKQTGLSRNQVSNWFINARVRLWKPMVEEIHMLETHQSQKASSQREEQQQPPLNALHNHHLPTSIDCENNASTSSQRIGPEFTLKRTRMDPTETPRVSDGLMRSTYDGCLFHNPQQSRVAAGGNNGGVSLTLGLHQNGVGLSENYPIHAARRLGLDSSGEGYVVSGFAAQNRQFGRDIMEGQIMHDFVG